MDRFENTIVSLRADKEGFPFLEDLDSMGLDRWRMVKCKKNPDTKGLLGLFIRSVGQDTDKFEYTLVSLRADKEGFPFLEDLDGMGLDGWKLLEDKKNPGTNGLLGLFIRRVPAPPAT
jgi:hypothetical protein